MRLVFLFVFYSLTVGAQNTSFFVTDDKKHLILFKGKYAIEDSYLYPHDGYSCQLFSQLIVWSEGTYYYSGDTLYLNDKLGFQQYLIRKNDKEYVPGKMMKGLMRHQWYAKAIHGYDSSYYYHSLLKSDSLLRGIDKFPLHKKYIQSVARNIDSILHIAKQPKGGYVCYGWMINGSSGIGRVTVRKKKTTCYIGDEIVFSGYTEFRDGQLHVIDTTLNFTFSFYVDNKGSLYPKVYRGFPTPIYIKKQYRQYYNTLN